MIPNELNATDANRVRHASGLAANLNGLVDVDLLLSKILFNARQVVKAEAGTIYLVNNGKLRFQSSQNDYLEKLIHQADELPFMGTNLDIDPNNLAGYAALNKSILTVNNTDTIEYDSPFQHLETIDASNNYSCKAVMSIPLLTHGDVLLGVLQLINPIDSNGQIGHFEPPDENILGLYAQAASLALDRALMLKGSVLNSLKLVELHDQTETTSHVQRISLLTTAIYKDWAEKRRVPSSEIDRVLNLLPQAAMLHDIGKAWIPTHILNKPGRLNKQEREVMEDHVYMGARLYAEAKTSLDLLIKDIISDHHERWDGLGYPGHSKGTEALGESLVERVSQPAGGHSPAGLGDGQRPVGQALGLAGGQAWAQIGNQGGSQAGDFGANGLGPRGVGKKGEEISIYGRILAVADVFDALSSRKIYKEPFDESLAVQIMCQESGRHFDPSVIESFLAVRPILAKIRERYPE
ncbi:MAG: HD domain-containing protein [Deltaproteobacteria bacterium]|nr:HD domain-containing protein [Deltaproteobacteria bacterium]